MLSLSLFLLCDFPFATYIVRYFLSAVQQAVWSNRLAAFLHAACVKGSAEASNAISAQHASLWINIAEVYYLLYCWSSVMISAVLHSLTLTLPPTASSDFFFFLAATAFASRPIRDGEPCEQGGAGRSGHCGCGLQFCHFQRQTPGLLEASHSPYGQPTPGTLQLMSPLLQRTGCSLTHAVSTAITQPAITTCQMTQPGVKI